MAFLQHLYHFQAQGIKLSLPYLKITIQIILSFQSEATYHYLFQMARWDGMSGIIETIAAYIILGERLKNIKQYIGLILICIGTFIAPPYEGLDFGWV